MSPHYFQNTAINSRRNEPPAQPHHVKTPATYRSKNKTKVGNRNSTEIIHTPPTPASKTVAGTRPNVFTSQPHRLINTPPEYHWLPGNSEIFLLSTG